MSGSGAGDGMAENEKNRAISVDAPVFVPLHMKGADEIAQVFGVSRETVVHWSKDGAPVHLVGKKYQASYAELWDWIKKKAESEKTCQVPTDYG